MPTANDNRCKATVVNKDRSALNKAIAKGRAAAQYVTDPFDALEAIDAAMWPAGFTLVDSDGTNWRDMLLCGDDSRATFKYARTAYYIEVGGETVHPCIIENSALIFSWHKMQSGNYEINAYIS